MKWWRWNKGRQGTDYDVFPFFISKFALCDCYLIRINTGTKIPKHTDKVKEGFRHFRLNIHSKKHEGGVFSSQTCIWRWRNVYFFRPDISEHSMTEVRAGRVLIFSFGFLLRSRNT